MDRRLLAVSVVLVVVVSGCFGISAPEQPSPGEDPDSVTPGTDSATPSETDAETPRPDPRQDRLGWEDGYWHNESISVDRSDGLNDTELEAVVSRSMARVEAIRGLEFFERVPVEVISRQEYKANYTGGDYRERDRLHQNTKWEATFVVGESTNALSVQESNRGTKVRGFYNFEEEQIVVVSENTASPKMNEIILAQELFHALQGQVFDAYNTSWYPGLTLEEHNAADGIIEGDGNYVDYLYEQRCEAEWDCLMPTGTPGGSGDLNVGMWAVSFQPYSDGTTLVQDRYQRNGWEAVNELYEYPPRSSEQVIHPEKYREDEPVVPEIDHSPSNGWRVLDMGPNSIDYATFGEAGLAVMLWYPSFAETKATGVPTDVVVPVRAFYNLQDNGRELQTIDPYNYDFPETAGWDGDRLVPYVTDESAATNETGYVWKLTWDTRADASEFKEAYVELLSYHDAEVVEDGIYEVPAESEFGDAISITQSGRNLTIVNAPTVADLDDVHEGAGPS